MLHRYFLILAFLFCAVSAQASTIINLYNYGSSGSPPPVENSPVFESTSWTGQSVTNATGSPVTSNNTLTAMSGITEGDLLIVCVGINVGGSGSATADTPSGWTLLNSKVDGVSKTYIFYKIADSGDESATDYNFSISVPALSGYVGTVLGARYSDVDQADPFDVEGFDSQQVFTSASSFSGTALTTTVDDTRVGIFAAMTPQPSPTYTPYDTGTSPTGYTVRDKSNTSSYDNIALVDKDQASAGSTGSFTFNITPNGDGSGAAAHIFRFALQGEQSTLLEGFENAMEVETPATRPDGVNAGGSTTADPFLSTSNVTNGTYSFEHSSTTAPDLYSFNQPSAPAGATKIKIDVFLPSGLAAFGAILANDSFAFEGKTTSGAGTLTRDVETTGDTFFFGLHVTGGGTVFWDNLRFTDNAGTLKGLINSFETATSTFSFELDGWTFANGAAANVPNITADTSWFTEGAQSLSLDIGTNDGGGYAYYLKDNPIDLTGYSELKIDYKDFSSNNTLVAIGLYVTAGSGALDPTCGGAAVNPGDAADGTLTITLDTGADLSACQLTILASDGTQVKIDKLRAIP